jgi:hypothetical protein
MPDSKPVSVVMPVYNGERFLSAALDSILSQSFTDFELIVVDDSSTDTTAEILDRYASCDPRIQVHRQPRNSGVTEALNAGIRHSCGHLIARMDADDVSLPHRLETQVRFMEANPQVAVVGGWVRRIDAAGRPGRVHKYPTEPALLAWSMLFFNSLAHPTVMMRREAIDTRHAYSTEYPKNEDYELFMRLSLSERLANIPEPLLLYRVWGGNVSSGDAQLLHSRRVICDSAAALGVRITPDQAAGLLGLSRGSYPSGAGEMSDLAHLLVELCAVYSRRVARNAHDRAAIASDASVRLWLLAALALRHQPALGAQIAGTALRTRPMAMFPFARKAVTRLVESRLHHAG